MSEQFLSGRRTPPSGGGGADDDDDIDAMFDKYLGDMDGDQLQALMAMGIGRDSAKHDDALEGLGRGGGDGSSDDDGLGVEERMGKLKSIKKKKVKSSTTSDGAVATSTKTKRSSSSVAGAEKSPPPKQRATATTAATTAGGPSRSPAKESTSSALTTAKRSASSSSSSAPKRSSSKGPATGTGSIGAKTSSGLGLGSLPSTVAKKTAGPTTASGGSASASSGITVRPSLLPTKGAGAKAPTLPSGAGTAGSKPSSASASSKPATPMAFGGGSVLSPGPTVDNPTPHSFMNTPPSQGLSAPPPPPEEDDAYDDDEEYAPSGGQMKMREPFRYEAPIKLSTGYTNKRSARDGNSNMDAPFTFQNLVEAVLTAEERAAKTTPEEVSEALAQAKIVDLSHSNVAESDDVMCLDNVTHLYLQHNRLTECEGIAVLMKLTVLVLSHNAIESMAPLQGLEQLIFLDVSFNNIAELDVEGHIPCERLVELRLTGNPCAPDYAVLEKCLGGDEEDANGDDNPTGAEGDEDIDGHLEYLEQYRAEILAFCPLLRFLDSYEVASFAPEHVAEAEEKDPKPRLLAHAVELNNNAATVAAGNGGVLLSEEAMLKEAEDAIDATMREDMDLDRDEEVTTLGNTLAEANDPFFVTQQQVRPSSNGGGGGGLSELQERLMEAYLQQAGGGQGGGGLEATLKATLSSASLRPGTASRNRGAADGSSSRPGTAGTRPSTAMAAAAVAALGAQSDDDSSDGSEDGDDDEGLQNTNTKSDPLAGGRLGKGRVGSQQQHDGSNTARQLQQSAPPEDRSYAKQSERQKELSKELALAQRHRDKLAELQLMEAWDGATAELRDLRIKSEERRSKLLFAAGNTASEQQNSGDALLASSSSARIMSASSSSAIGRLGHALQQSKASTGNAPTPNSSAGGKKAFVDGTPAEMQHSSGYLAALERLRKDAGVVGDINRYRK